MPRWTSEHMDEIIRSQYKVVDLNNLGEHKPTNADRIRAMSDEELANWILGIDHYWNDGECIVSFGKVHIHDSSDSILEWLQSEAE